jgi:hypothetical protein
MSGGESYADLSSLGKLLVYVFYTWLSTSKNEILSHLSRIKSHTLCLEMKQTLAEWDETNIGRVGFVYTYS